MSNFWRKRYAIEQRYLETIGADIPHCSGIYLWTREEDGITYFYVGQARDLNKRRFDYYCIQCGIQYPTRHFEASLKKHKDWKFFILNYCDEKDLNEMEKYYIDKYNALPNHITRNESKAGQDIVQSNAKRLDRVIKKYEENIKKMLKHLDFSIADNCISHVIRIEPKRKKNGMFTEQGKKSFTDFITWIQKLRLENYVESDTIISKEDTKQIIESEYHYDNKPNN